MGRRLAAWIGNGESRGSLTWRSVPRALDTDIKGGVRCGSHARRHQVRNSLGTAAATTWSYPITVCNSRVDCPGLRRTTHACAAPSRTGQFLVSLKGSDPFGRVCVGDPCRPFRNSPF